MKKKQEMKVQLCDPGDLRGHPANRRFETEGEGWEAFVASVRQHGVITPCLARVAEDGCAELVAGHRRTAAALEIGVKVPVIFCEMTAKEALEMVVLENLERQNLTPVDEAEAVRHLLAGLDLSEEALAARLKRSVEWVRTRQGLLDLGSEVLEAVSAPREERRHLPLGSVREILRVPEEWREEAVQLVLHPSFQDGALGPEEARDVLRRCLVEPKRKAAAWEAAKKDLQAAWQERLNECMPAGQEVLVRVGRWEEEVRGGMDAEERVPSAELLATAPQPPGGLRWCHVAAKHGLAAAVVPVKDGEPRCLVAAPLLRQAEESLAEFVRGGGEGQVWLVTKFGKVTHVPAESREDEEDEPETVIEQRMEHRKWVDLERFHALNAAVASGNASSLPPWLAGRMSDPDTVELVLRTADWVLGEDAEPTHPAESL